MRPWLLVLAGCGRLGFSDQPLADASTDAVVADAVIADAPGSLIEPGHSSGTRLRAIAWHVGDASVFARWFDMTLNAPCFSTATTAGQRCVPTEAPLVVDLFADGACAQPLYGTQLCVDGDPRILTHEAGGTVNGYRDQTKFTGQIYTLATGVCKALQGSWPYPLYTGGTAHAASELPALALQTSTVGAIQLHEEVGDDGAHRVVGFADPATGLPCHLDAATPGVAACVPDAPIVSSGVFADTACTEPAYVLPKDNTPAWVRLDPDDACSDARMFLPVGAASGAHSPNGGACLDDILATGFSAFTVGAPRTRASFPSGMIVARGSTLAWVTDALDVEIGAWDPALQIGCYFGPDTAQHSRCYPQTAVSFANSWATDSSCGASQWQAASCRPPQFVPYTFGGSSCDFTGQTAGAIDQPGATPYVANGTTCTAVSGAPFVKWDGGATPSTTFQPASSVLE